MPKFLVLALAVGILPGPPVEAQPKAEFEVASHKLSVSMPSPPGATRTGGGDGLNCPTRYTIEQSRLDIRCFTLLMLIGHAFEISPDQIIGPEWIANQPRFDIAAKLPPSASERQVPIMLQALLADRLQLAIHREHREHAAYAIVVAPSGLKATRAPAIETDTNSSSASGTIVNTRGAQTRVTNLPPQGGKPVIVMTGDSIGTIVRTTNPDGVERMVASDITIAGLAGLLNSLSLTNVPMPIVDMTGLEGRYQITLEISFKEMVAARTEGPLSDPASDPGIFAVQIDQYRRSLQKYGLRLESRKAPMEIIVVDGAVKVPSES